MQGDATKQRLDLGIDVGSTTVKAVVIDPKSKQVLYSEYKRHGAHQAHCTADAFERIADAFPNAVFNACITGSGAAPLAAAIDIPYVQEVVANSIAVRELYPNTRTAIELGGQDAKMVFFQRDEQSGNTRVADMRMNGSCAGGTGAFIDEIAGLLRIPVEEFDAAAKKGTRVYDVSGRCGVYAKTDIQPLLNQGVPKEDLALSTFHAIAKQSIGGLAQGLDINPPVIFEGGPLTFNTTLVKVFCERLGLERDDVVIPDHPETIVALGAALALQALYADEDHQLDLHAASKALEDAHEHFGSDEYEEAPRYFESDAERTAFQERHMLEPIVPPSFERGSSVDCYLGIDCGSTTTKFVLLGVDGEPFDSFYASNEGEPLDVARCALGELKARYDAQEVQLNILGCGTTGYGEMLLAKAFHADYHVVETVAHATAARRYQPNATFILDIGGQDMKAIWIDDGIVTDIVVNEACSSGCGSFLDSFASTLGIAARDIASNAFASDSPAVLGSRCTVFMNSSIVSEQRRGKLPQDIMAGLCRSIIENVFTKVIRVSNMAKLGDHIVVQGGTFMNDAVLRAFEQYVGRDVTRAPYPGLMGAIGAALLTKEHMEQQPGGCSASSFVGLGAASHLSYTQESNVVCPFCANRCKRSIITFGDDVRFVTGNRCPRGEVVGDPKSEETRAALKQASAVQEGVPNLYEERKELLFADYPVEPLCEDRNTRIGLPRVLALWDNAPFWTTFWRALGFEPVLSPMSTRKMYEDGLHAVTSDTVCFPAKLVHGHIRALARRKVDRIFMPIVTVVQSEGTEATAESMCAVVKGYPMVVSNSDNPTKQFGIPFDTPLWHWYTPQDRDKQLTAWMQETFGIHPDMTLAAIAQASAAQESYRTRLEERGAQVLAQCEANGTYAMVLASRPYQNDDLVNHDLPRLFTEQGIPVLTADSLAGVRTEVLRNSLIDVANNFHARMLSSALIAARSPHLEYTQVVSFGCGHDAYLSDEIIRLMHETSGKTPLVLKVDESDVQGPLRIRVRSFVETVNTRRKQNGQLQVKELQDPYPVKFTKECAKTKTVLVPNTSHAFSLLMSAAFSAQGLNAVSLPVGREEAIRLGKEYVHNDICFPCQIVIGEALAALESGKFDPNTTAVGMGKYVGDCRLTQYTALLRKALDDAGYNQVPIITNDDVDYHQVHPGYKMSLLTAMRIAFGLPMIDALEELLRKMRPYELEPGSADAAFERAVQITTDGIKHGGIRGGKKAFKQAIEIMKQVKYDRSNPRPTVLIVGEYLLNFHPGANHEIERYLEDHGLEVVEARMTDVIRKTYFYKDAQVKEYDLNKPLSYKAMFRIENNIFNLAHDATDSIASAHPLYERAARMDEIAQDSDPVIHHTFDAGEGVLIPAEIIHNAKKGCRAFIILQPFGCLPNHVVGRGISKRLKEMYPNAHILPLDYDPDVSFANIENRLQMLIMDLKAGGVAVREDEQAS